MSASPCEYWNIREHLKRRLIPVFRQLGCTPAFGSMCSFWCCWLHWLGFSCLHWELRHQLIHRHPVCAASSENWPLELSCNSVLGLQLPLLADICLLCHICQISQDTSAVSQHLRYCVWAISLTSRSFCQRFQIQRPSTAALETETMNKGQACLESKLRLVFNFQHK